MAGVQTIGILGAGEQGRNLAYWALRGGYRVILEETFVARLAESREYVLSRLADDVTGEIMDVHARDTMAAQLITVASVDEVSRGGDLLIEAGPEDPELQLEMFTIFDKFAKPNAVLASTSTSVSIADLAEMTNCPERCVGLRVQETEGQHQRLQIIANSKTDEGTLRVCAEVARRMGLEMDVLQESAGSTASTKESHSR